MIASIVLAMRKKEKNSVPVLTKMTSEKPCFGCDEKLPKGSEQYLVEALDAEICSRCCGQIMRKLGRRYTVGIPGVRWMIFIRDLPEKK